MLALLVTTIAIIGGSWAWPLVPPVMIALLLLVLVVTVVLGRTWLRGRAAMRAGRYDEAIALFEAFQAERAASALPLLWASLYTTDPVALSLNNIGACHLSARRADRALAPLGEALARDPGYAMPHVNLAIAHRLLGDPARSQSHAELARSLGFGRDALEAALRRAVAATNVRIGASLG
jgi:predicted Zn-dependent protease